MGVAELYTQIGYGCYMCARNICWKKTEQKQRGILRFSSLIPRLLSSMLLHLKLDSFKSNVFIHIMVKIFKIILTLSVILTLDNLLFIFYMYIILYLIF